MPAGRPRPARSRLLPPLAASLLLALASVGCGNLPREQLVQCQNRSQLLQAEASRLKDESTQLRSKNRELAQRAVEDARRLRGLEEANRRLEKSVVAYQDQRDQVQRVFNDLKRELIAAADNDTRRADNTLDTPPPRTELAAIPRAEPLPDDVQPLPNAPEPLSAEPLAAEDAPLPPGPPLPEALVTFVQDQPRTRLTANGQGWTIPATALFEPGADTLSPRGAFLLARFSQLATSSGVQPRSVTASPDVEPIQRTSAEDDPERLPDRRALAVRDHLARLLNVDSVTLPARVGSESDASSHDPEPTLTIDLIPPR